MRLAEVGLVAGIAIANVSATEAPDWVGQSLFERVRDELANVGIRNARAKCFGGGAAYPARKKYSEHSLGVTWWPDKIITLRPELRFDHSYDTPAFDNGKHRNQFVVSMDFIIHY